MIVIHKLKMIYMGFINYSYLIVDENTMEASIIDPAWNLTKINEIITNLNIKLKSILLTHSHFDHINLVDDLLKKYNPIVYISKVESDFYNYHTQNMNRINDLSTISIGNSNCLCILTPGHSKGGMSFYIDGNLFTGDTIFVEGCGICQSLGGSAKDLYESVQVIKRFPDNTIIWPGHSFGIPVGQKLSTVINKNIYFQIYSKKIFEDFACRKQRKGIFDFK